MRFSGSGGQGILLAAAIIAEGAAALGKQVVQTQTTGRRPGAEPPRPRSSSSDEAIDYPEVQHPDINLVPVAGRVPQVRCRHAARRPAHLRLRAGRDRCGGGYNGRACGLPFTQAATDELGKKVVTNIVSLGAFVALSGVLPADAVEQAVLNRVPARFRELNEQAFRLGLRLADKAATQAMQDAAAQSH